LCLALAPRVTNAQEIGEPPACPRTWTGPRRAVPLRRVDPTPAGELASPGMTERHADPEKKRDALARTTAVVSLIATMAGGVWVVFEYFDEKNEKAIAAQKEQRANERDTAIQKELEELKQAQAREQVALQMTQHAIDLWKDNTCHADLMALSLLWELLDVQRSRSATTVGTATERAVFSRLAGRMGVSRSGTVMPASGTSAKPYCDCASILTIIEFTKEGRDKEISGITEQIAQAASKPGGPCASAGQEVQTTLADAATATEQRKFFVVLNNALNCSTAQAARSQIDEALRRELGTDYSPDQLHLRRATWRGRTVYVTAYGGNLSLETASSMVQRLSGKNGLAEDLYWARGTSFQDGEACSTPPR